MQSPNLWHFLLLFLQSLHLANCGFSIKRISLQVFDSRFVVALQDEPGIRWVDYHVNVNKPFRSFERGQFAGELTSATLPNLWAYEFHHNLRAGDTVHIWLSVLYKDLLYRDKQDPITVGSDATSITPKPQSCVQAVTVLSSGNSNLCKDDLIFEENFDTILSASWTNEVFIASIMDDAPFVMYNGTASVKNGILRLEAKVREGGIVNGYIDLNDRCTSVDAVECSLRPSSSFFLPPVVSGRVSTKNSFNFKYGRIEVRARLPKGDWLVPIIALQPSSNKYGRKAFVNGEMRIAFARGNHELKAGNTNIDGKRLFGGIILKAKANDRHRFMANVTLDEVSGNEEHFGNQFHLYSMIWSPREIILMVDGFQYGLIKTNFKEQISERAWRLGPENAPLDQMYYLTLGLSVGGHGDFPDDSENKPWENTSPRGISTFFDARGQWHPLWERPALEVDYVRIYAV